MKDDESPLYMLMIKHPENPHICFVKPQSLAELPGEEDSATCVSALLSITGLQARDLFLAGGARAVGGCSVLQRVQGIQLGGFGRWGSVELRCVLLALRGCEA